MEKEKYYSLKIEEVYRKLQSSPLGLSNQEVRQRVQKYGLNELPQKEQDSIFKIFISELLDPIVLLLLVAIVASLFVGEVVDAVAIMFIVLVDLIIGTYEENKANQTIDALSKLVPEKVRVNRNGEEIRIDSKDLTVGDYVFLESGDKISADMRVVEAHNFTVDESILTGESLAVVKDSKTLAKKELAITYEKYLSKINDIWRSL